MKAVPNALEFRPDSWAHTYCWEEEPVLTCALSLPVIDRPGGPSARRVSRYYARLARWLRSQWEQQAFPAACAALRTVREASLPFHPYRESVSFQVTRNSGGLFSLYWDSSWDDGGPQGMTARWGDTWDLASGCPLSMADFFPPRAEPERLLPPLAERQAAEAMDAGVSLFHPDYPQLLRSRFDRKRFYIDEHNLFFFYPLRAVAPRAEGIPVFSVPLENGLAAL